MSEQFTPGPWHVSDDDGKRVMAGDEPIARIWIKASDPQERWLETLDANARLIAAAPDLLASLKEMKQMLAWFVNNAPDDYIIDFLRAMEFQARMERADAAIAKAKGEAQP